MAVDPAMPPDLAREINDLKARLSKLERLSQLGQSSIDAGALRLLTSDKHVVLAAGNVDFDGTVGATTTGYGTFVYDGSDSLVFAAKSGQRGRIYPAQPLPMHSATGQQITGSTFASIFETEVLSPDGDVYQIQGAVTTDASCTGEIRLTCGTHHTSVISVPASTSAFYRWDWLHPGTTGLFDDRTGREQNLFLQLEARRVTGTGTMRLFPPQRSEITSSWLVSTADTDGNGVLV